MCPPATRAFRAARLHLQRPHDRPSRRRTRRDGRAPGRSGAVTPLAAMQKPTIAVLARSRKSSVQIESRRSNTFVNVFGTVDRSPSRTNLLQSAKVARRAAVYERLQVQIAELRERLGGLPSYSPAGLANPPTTLRMARRGLALGRSGGTRASAVLGRKWATQLWIATDD